MRNMQLNLEQLKAVKHGEGPCMVLAGPGSGKTAVITKRIQFLIREKHISPQSILVITFTKAAALEMEKRFVNLMNDSYYPVTFSTFHSFFFSILQLCASDITLSVLDDKEKSEILSEILLSLGIPCDEHTTCIQFYLKHDFSNKMNHPVISYPLSEEQFMIVDKRYQYKKKALGKVDFDDMEVLCEKLLNDNPKFLDEVRNQYQYILVDEFQDVNERQFQILHLLCHKHRNLFVVGDDDQAIYGFRGSKPNIMLDFPVSYPDYKQIVLSKNYRSSKAIVYASKTLIRHNKHRFHKNIQAVKEDGKGVEICLLEDRQEIINCIKERVKNLETAIICRTNQELVQIQGMLQKEGIHSKIYKQKSKDVFDMIMKDLESYFIMADYHKKTGKYPREHFVRIMNKPKRYLGRHSVFEKEFLLDELRCYYASKPYMKKIINDLEKLLLKIENLDFYSALWFIRKKGGYENYLIEYCKEKKVDITQCIGFLELLQKKAKDIKKPELLFAETRKWQMCHKNYENPVHLLTYHASKGLEFDRVILINLIEGLVPHKKNKDTEEERRMFYVAMTRAKNHLVMIAWKKDGERECVLSRFLLEILNKKEPL